MLYIPEKKHNVLLIDDSEIDRFLCKELFDKHKYNVYELEEGSDVISIVSKCNIDIVVTDYLMPSFSGEDVIVALRNEKFTMGIPIIVITGLKDENVLEKIFSLGANDYITKPITRTEINIRVENLLKLEQAYIDVIERNKQLKELNEIVEFNNVKLKTTLEENRELAKIKQEVLSRDIESYKKRLFDININNTRTLEQFSFLLKEIDNLKALVQPKLDVEDIKYIDNIKRKVTKFMNSDESWTEFKEIYEFVSNGFFDKLKTINPKLTSKDLKICAYINLDIDFFEIAQMMYVDPSSFKMNRYRLKQKLNVPKNQSLKEFLTILSQSKKV